MGHAGLRRAVSVSVVVLMAFGLVASLPVWAPVLVVADAVRGRWRLPLARLVLFGLLWAWVELAGIIGLFVLWLSGRSGVLPAHYRLQRRWCGGIIRGLRLSTGLRVTVEGTEKVGAGPYVVLCRHASLADSIISCYIVNNTLGLAPRYVLKSELQAVPCLDILGHRMPNAFVTRGTSDVGSELRTLQGMVAGLAAGQAAVIFPEGSRANEQKRARELSRLAERHPGRHAVLAGLSRLIPPKPSGAAAILEGAPGADVITVWHSGLDGLDTFGGIIRALTERRVNAHFVVEVAQRDEVPSGNDFPRWLDAKWMEMDLRVVEHENANGRRNVNNG